MKSTNIWTKAAAEFKNNGLAPMRRGDDGTTQLDCGRRGGQSEGLIITYEKNGMVVGRSAAKGCGGKNSSIEARVLDARNTIFSQELWHELTRESRSLAAYDVRPEGSRLTCTLDATTKVIIELQPLESCFQLRDDGGEDLQGNKVAETISMALHILLSYAHRCNELMRIRPIPPHVSRTRGQQTYALLRPIIARMKSIANTETCTRLVGGLVQALQKAGIPSSFTLHTPQASPIDAASRGPNQVSGAQTLIRNMLQAQEFTIDLTILPDVSLTVRGRTFLFPVTATYYHILVPPTSKLLTICAPHGDGYPDADALGDYLHAATIRVLTEHFLSLLIASRPAGSTAELVQSVQGTSIRGLDRDSFNMQFEFEASENSALSLLITSTTIIDNRPNTTKWEWTGDNSKQSEPRTLQDIVQAVANQALS